MINTLAEFIAIFAECFIVTRMLIIYFKLKSDEYKLLKSAALFTALFITDVLGSFCIINELFLISTCVLCEFGFAVVFLKGSMNEKILISLMNYALLYFINLPVIMLISTISDMSASHLVASQNAEKIICLFIGKLLQFFITELLLWNRRKEEYRFKFNEWMVILSAFFITLMIGFVMYIITIDRHITNYVYLAVTLLLSILDIIIFVFMRKMNVVNRKEKERELLDMVIQQQQDKLSHIEHQYEELSILRHDFRNGIDCMCGMIAQGDCTGALSYAEKLKERKINTIKNHIHSSSTVINAVINSKFSEAGEKNIETSARIVVPIPEYLEFDLSILLSNLLDNAIEACQKNKKASQIVLTISDEAGYYRIIVRNTIDKSVLKGNSKLKTDKHDKKRHGWGLKSVEDIVAKHSGLIDFYENENEFFVDIMLTIKD